MKETVNWSFEDQQFTTNLEVEARPQEALSIADRIRRLADEVERMENGRGGLTEDVQRLRERDKECRRLAEKDAATIGILGGLVLIEAAVAVWGWLV